MNATVKKLLVAVAAGALTAVGTSIGTFAADQLKEKLKPPEPPPAPTKKKRAR